MEQREPPDDSLAAHAMAAVTQLHPDSRGKLSLGKIRHGLRTPINHIIGYAELLQEDAAAKLPDGFLTDLEKIRIGGNVLLAQINQHFNEDRFCAAAPDLHALCHELRTPVNYIIGNGEMLAEQCDDAGQPEFKSDLAKIVSAARGAALSRQLLASDGANCVVHQNLKLAATSTTLPSNVFLASNSVYHLASSVSGDGVPVPSV
jgi:signal transduction histidine kinase